MAPTDYFKALELDPYELMRLNDHDAEKMVRRAYDRLVSAANQGDATENPRVELWNDAKNTLCDPVMRRHHAEKLQYLDDDGVPFSPPPPTPPPTDSTRWWIAALIAAPGVLLYLIGAGAILPTLAQPIFWFSSFALLWTATGRAGPAILGTMAFGFLGGILAFWSYDGFSRNVASWNVSPAGVATGLLIILGALFFKILGTLFVKARASWDGRGTPGFFAACILLMFTLSLVLIPVAGTVVPVRENLTAPTVGTVTDCAPTREIEESLNLSRRQRRLVQAGLGTTGYSTGRIDGLFGPRTRAAIREWQQAQTDCTATGYLNQRQSDSLMALAPQPPEPPAVPPAPGQARGPEGPTQVARSRVVIEAEPESDIAIDGEAVGTTGETGTLAVDDILPGEHRLTATRPGFEPISRTIEVVAGISQVVSLTFQPLPGRLTVTANVDNAYVGIDTGYAGFAPVTELEVNAGTRQITVSSPGYEPDQQLVTLPPDGSVTHHVILKRFPVEEFTDQIEQVFSSGAYEEAADAAGNLVRVLDIWIATGVEVEPDNLSRALTIEGRSLFELNRFPAATAQLYRAILEGGRVELPVKHRHGGGGLRPGFCRGTLSLSLNEVGFEAVDDPDHGFAVPPSGITNVERAGARNGFLFRLNTEVDGRGDMDFVHPNAERQPRDPDSGLQIDLTCPDCNQALEVHAALLLRLSQS